MRFVAEAFKHGKAIGALAEGTLLLAAARLNGIDLGNVGDAVRDEQGVIIQPTGGGASVAFTEALSKAIAAHRHFTREMAAVPV